MKHTEKIDIYRLFYGSLIFFGSYAIAVDIGSDTSVDRFSVSQTLNEGDRVAGFAALEAGFSLSGVVTATFDSFFPVSGAIDINGGTLVLNRDLILGSVADIVGLGDIVGNNHTLQLAATSTCVPSGLSVNDCFIFSDIKLVLNCNVALKDCCVRFSGDSVINGRGHSLDLDPTCTIIIDDDSTLCLKNITVKNVSDVKIQGSNANSCLQLKQVEWVLDEDYCFSEGKFEVIKDFLVTGDGYAFVYKTGQQSTVEKCGKMILDHGVTFSYDPSPSAENLLKLVENTSQLCLNGATLHTTTTGLRLTRGQLIVDRSSCLSSEGTTEGGAIKFGDGVSSSNNLDIQLLPAAVLTGKQGFVVIDNV